MQQNSQQQGGRALQGKRVAILMTDGVEQVEYTGPRSFLEEQGAQVTLVSPKPSGDEIQGFNHMDLGDKFKVELDVRDARPADFDALVLPGGVANPDQLRLSTEAITFIREFGRENKPIAAICHGPWTLIDADLVTGKRMTSWPTLQLDLELVAQVHVVEALDLVAARLRRHQCHLGALLFQEAARPRVFDLLHAIRHEDGDAFSLQGAAPLLLGILLHATSL